MKHKQIYQLNIFDEINDGNTVYAVDYNCGIIHKVNESNGHTIAELIKGEDSGDVVFYILENETEVSEDANV